MTSINVTEARNSLSKIIHSASEEAVFLERRGKLAAVVISPEEFERMVEALEEVEDIAAFDEAMADEGSNIPWAQAKSDLGWA